ncbi:MAG: hypothetical protein TU36_003320 [Vulcanisaeta sp. AZ3]
MSIVKGVYEGLTALIYAFVLDVMTKVLLLMGFTDLLYDLIQLILVILWIGIGMVSWGSICIINRSTCRLSTMYRYLMFIVTPIMAISYISYMYRVDVLAVLLFLIAVSLILGLSVAGYVGVIILGNQFKSNVGRVGAAVSIVATIMWLTLILKVMEIGVAINAFGNILIIVLLLQLRRRYSPTRGIYK